jgi:hypothetical protein
MKEREKGRKKERQEGRKKEEKERIPCSKVKEFYRCK